MKRENIRTLFAIFLAVLLCLFLIACGERSENPEEPSATPEPVTSQSPEDPTAGAFTPTPSFDPEAPSEPTPSPTPAEPVKIDLHYEDRTVTELSFMTSSVFQLQAVTSDGSSGGIWTSSDASSASVDENGVVTCWKVGNPKITYTQGESSASCTLNITEPKVRILYLGVDKNDISLSGAWGFEIQLTSLVTPEGSEVTWSSDNETVATVSDTGYVTAHAMGNATITCKCGTAKATCIVRVTGTPPTYVATVPAADDNTPRVIITYAGILKDDVTINVDTSLDMDYVLYNIDPNTPVTWSVEDPEYLSVNENGVITGKKTTFGVFANRNYTKLIVTCGEYTGECIVFVKEK